MSKTYESVKEWIAEGTRLFGEDLSEWKYRCPMCGHVASVKDFEEAGAEDAPNDAPVECIGRYTGKGGPSESDGSGCNWAAYGLFKIPNDKGVKVRQGDKYIDVFAFAEEEANV